MAQVHIGADVISKRAITVLLFAIAASVASGVMVRQCMSEPEEEVRAPTHAPTPTRVLSVEERVPTWTPTAIATPTPTATYTPTATATYTPTPLPTLIASRIEFAGGQVDTQRCGRITYEQIVRVVADILGKAESDYAPFDCLWFLQKLFHCSKLNGAPIGLNLNGTLLWTYWTKADGSFVTIRYLDDLWQRIDGVDESCLVNSVAKQ